MEQDGVEQQYTGEGPEEARSAAVVARSLRMPTMYLPTVWPRHDSSQTLNRSQKGTTPATMPRAA